MALKNGFFGSGQYGYRVNSVGFVADPRGGGYVVAVFTDGHAGLAAGIPMAEMIAAAVNAGLGR